MNLMFEYCDSLKYLDLSNFNTSKVNNSDNMFYGINSLNILFYIMFKLIKLKIKL